MTESQASHYDDVFELARAIECGEAFEAFRDGELDDLIDHATLVSMQKGTDDE